MQARVRNRHVTAVGGWKYFQPQTGMSFNEWDFKLICQKVQQHRKSNPRFGLSTNLVDVENDVDEANALRMLSMPGAESYVETVGSTIPKFRPPSNPSSPNVADASERLIGGAKIVAEMFGPQGPVSPELANKRASICSECPLNEKGDWTRWFTVPASAIVRQMLEVVHNMKLSTPYDDKLVFCSACSCPLKGKVWAPLEHIKAHTPQESLDRVDPKCWIRNNDA